MRYEMPFSLEDLRRAYDEWGCNCGPAALAFALQVPIDDVRYVIPGFDQKRYTSPSMMAGALTGLEVRSRSFKSLYAGKPVLVLPTDSTEVCLVRIQWAGPWTYPGTNPRWAYRQTHWIAAWWEAETMKVFDVNSGVVDLLDWTASVVPEILRLYPRASGLWWPTHVWRIEDHTAWKSKMGRFGQAVRL